MGDIVNGISSVLHNVFNSCSQKLYKSEKYVSVLFLEGSLCCDSQCMNSFSLGLVSATYMRFNLSVCRLMISSDTLSSMSLSFIFDKLNRQVFIVEFSYNSPSEKSTHMFSSLSRSLNIGYMMMGDSNPFDL